MTRRADIKTVEEWETYQARRRSRWNEGATVDASVEVPVLLATKITAAPPYLVGLCRAAGLPEPKSEYHFAPPRKWRFDYAFLEQKIAVEIEGGIWKKGGGAHSHPVNIMRDIEKYNAAAVLGWRILRYMPEDMMNSLNDLKQCLKADETVPR